MTPRPKYLRVRNWKKFQHYSDRRPIWIKTYLDLLDRDDYLELPPATRAVLHGVWLLTARSPQASSEQTPSEPRALRGDTASLSRALHMKVTKQQLKALCAAGFITLSASKVASKSVAKPEQIDTVLARARVETETEEEKEGKGRKVESSSKNGVVQPEDAEIDIAKEVKLSLLVAMVGGEEDKERVASLCRRATLASLEKVYESATHVRMANPNAYILTALADENAMVRAARRARAAA